MTQLWVGLTTLVTALFSISSFTLSATFTMTVCAPSRASLLTGLTQGNANVRDNQFDKELADTHTLGTVMQKAGYATAAFGKWGLQGGDWESRDNKNPKLDAPARAWMKSRASRLAWPLAWADELDCRETLPLAAWNTCACRRMGQGRRVNL